MFETTNQIFLSLMTLNNKENEAPLWSRDSTGTHPIGSSRRFTAH
jgi:hypothetical protein